MKRFLLSAALLLACSGVALAQESEFSGGGGGGITAAPGSGTAGRVPQFASTTSLEDSKMLTSGTNSGTWTLYDSTAVTGVTSLVVRAGAAGDAWATKLIDIRNNANTSTGGFVANGGTVSVWADDFRDPGSTIFDLNGSAYDALSMRSSFDLLWSSGAMSTGTGDVGISRSAAGILKVTNGSTGVGSFWAGGGTLYDDTAVTGSTAFTIRAGAGQSTNPLAVMYANDGTTARYTFGPTGIATFTVDTTVNDFALKVGRSGATSAVHIGDQGYGAGGQINVLSNGYVTYWITSTAGAEMSRDHTILWSSDLYITGARDLGLSRPMAGMLKVTDGSTGQGGIGIADSATNTVSDALILRHATSGTAAASFGTGLLFQGENAAGTMHDMASIDAVYANAADTTEQTHLVFKNYHLGAEATFLTMWQQFGETYLAAPGFLGLNGSSVRIQAQAASPIYFATANADRWLIDSSGHLQPNLTNTYDIGTSSAFVRNNYVSTSIQGTRDEVIPTDNVAENFVQISSATENAVTAGYIEYTVTAVDTTNEIIQTETGVVPFVAVNENTTVTSTLGTPYGVHQDNAGGAALAVSFAAVVTGTNVMMTVTSNYDQATLTGTVVNTLRYRVVLTSGTATVTPQT